MITLDDLIADEELYTKNKISILTTLLARELDSTEINEAIERLKLIVHTRENIPF